jgi:nitroreductase
MEFIKLAQERYSLRKMTNQKIKKGDLNKILEVARLSPTAKNKQEQRILVVDNQEELEKVRECTPCHFNAQTILVLSYEKEFNDEGQETEESQKYGLIDIGIIVSHMALEATDLGLGTTIVGLFNKELLKEKLNIPLNYEPVLLLPIGYSDNKGPSHLHSDRLPLDKTTKYNKY